MESEDDVVDVQSAHKPSDLLRVGLVYWLGGGGVLATIGARFWFFSAAVKDTPAWILDRNAGIMFFIFSGLISIGGIWCLIKRARLLKASE
jgi:hypothetical protein